jgi:hypothetical protein
MLKVGNGKKTDRREEEGREDVAVAGYWKIADLLASVGGNAHPPTVMFLGFFSL